MKTIDCMWCGNPVRTVEDTIEITCGTCSMKKSLLAEANRKARVSEYKPRMCKKKRKARGWTQRDLAFHLGIADYKVGQFESNRIECPKEIREWLDEN